MRANDSWRLTESTRLWTFRSILEDYWNIFFIVKKCGRTWVWQYMAGKLNIWQVESAIFFILLIVGKRMFLEIFQRDKLDRSGRHLRTLWMGFRFWKSTRDHWWRPCWRSFLNWRCILVRSAWLVDFLIRGKKGCKLHIEEHLREGRGRFEGSFFEFFLVFRCCCWLLECALGLYI